MASTIDSHVLGSITGTLLNITDYKIISSHTILFYLFKISMPSRLFFIIKKKKIYQDIQSAAMVCKE
jgi:hypothetical protein